MKTPATKRLNSLLALAALFAVACGPSDAPEGEDASDPSATATPTLTAAPDGDAVPDGEESGEQLARDQTYDEERAGTRLVLAYDEAANVFAGTVENISDEPLSRVRVEVHLSNGIELGPTVAMGLAPGESHEVSLAASDEPFDTWSAHAEVGDGEGGHEGDGEHDGEGEHEGEGGEHQRSSAYSAPMNGYR